MRLSTKLLVISELVLLVLAFALLVPTRSVMREQVTVDLQNQLAAIASTAALQLNGDLHQRVVDTQDPHDPAFLALRDQLRAVRDVNGLKSDHLYTFYVGEDQLLHFGVMPHEGEPFIGDEYNLKPHHQQALDTHTVQVTELYSDVNGKWISAAAPIRDSAGTVVGLLEVTQPSEAYFARADNLVITNTAIAIIGIAISSLLGYVVLTRL
ncbi:MAG: PDC sensor domain-containing protein, partial [Planctomycetota bacterium]